MDTDYLLEFKQVKGFKLYLINRIGEVYRPDRSVFIKIQFGNYPSVSLRKDKKYHTKSLHRLIAETFIPNPDNKPQVNHIDGNKHNYHYSNLEWATPKENIKHYWQSGVFDTSNNKKAKSNNGKKQRALTDKDILRIRNSKGKYSVKQIADIFQIPTQLVYNIFNNRTYKDV